MDRSVKVGTMFTRCLKGIGMWKMPKMSLVLVCHFLVISMQSYYILSSISFTKNKMSETIIIITINNYPFFIFNLSYIKCKINTEIN